MLASASVARSFRRLNNGRHTFSNATFNMEDVLVRLKALEEANVELKSENARLLEALAKTRDDDEAKRVSEAASEAARTRVTLKVVVPLDTKLIGRPENFSGKEEDVPRFSLTMRAHAGGFGSRLHDFLLLAKDPEASIDRVDAGDPTALRPRHDAQGSELRQDRAGEYGEGLRLWRLLVGEFEPKWKSRKTAI